MTDEQPPEQAVLIYLDGNGLPDEIYANYDVATLEDQIVAVLEDANVGEYDGNEFGPDSVTLFLYGNSADVLYATIEPILKEYPLCQGAEVILQYGEPGAQEKKFRLAQ